MDSQCPVCRRRNGKCGGGTLVLVYTVKWIVVCWHQCVGAALSAPLCGRLIKVVPTQQKITQVYSDTLMARVPVHKRRHIFKYATWDVWLCESCGEDNQEELAVYEIVRRTRAYRFRGACLCAECAERIPVGRVLSS